MKVNVDKPLLVLLCMFFMIVSVGVIFLFYGFESVTGDKRFATSRGLLECEDDFVYNATFGLARPHDPDYFFCSPYPQQPQSVLYKTPESKGKYVISEEHTLSVYTSVCPEFSFSPGYRMFVGDWQILGEMCSHHGGFAYLHSRDFGYNHFCCVPYFLFKEFDREADKLKVLSFEETPLVLQGM